MKNNPDPLQLYTKTSYNISRIITRNYSTSFYIATLLLKKDIKDAIYSIYGFVRIADEIVDTFHDYNKKHLIDKFESDFYDAMHYGISSNPVLNSFKNTVSKYKITDDHVQAFLKSMKLDLSKKDYIDKLEINEYIYGSADIVGLMCLRVFCNGDDKLYRELEKSAMKLGSAFQKVNFLRDLKNDIENLDRRYFPEINIYTFNEYNKLSVIKDIENDFDIALTGIKQLPQKAKLSVLIAFYYYKNLLKKIKKTPANKIIETRIRVSNEKKMYLLVKAAFVYKLKLV